MVVGEFTQESDVLVIGGGPAGYGAAFAAAATGKSTALVESREALGGVCLHDGCIPSKTMLHVADVLASLRAAAGMGVDGSPEVVAARLQDHVGATIETLARGLDQLASKHGVDRLVGSAMFEDGRHVGIPGSAVPRVRFRRVIIATGSRPAPHPAAPFEGARIISADQAVRQSSVPGRLLVVGSDYQAAEVASIYAALGSTVRLICPAPALLPAADADLVRHVLRRLKKMLRGVDIGMDLQSAEVRGDGVDVRIGTDTETERFDQVVIAVGRVPNVDGLNLDALDIERDAAGFITVNDRQQTSNPRVLAAGDVTGPPLLATRALAQGRVAGAVAAGSTTVGLDATAIPTAIFTDPQIAWCGLNERALEATAAADEYAVVKLPWGASGRAVGIGRSDGLTKIIYERATRIVVGVGLCGVGAAELIAEGCLAVEMGAQLDDLAGTLHPHPSTCELLADAARSAPEA